MSNPRKIVVNDQQFVYTLNAQYDGIDGTSRVALTLFRAESRRRAFAFRFHTWEDVVAGSPLMVGIDLRYRETGGIERWNLHHPGRVRLFVLYALESGWGGNAETDAVDGIGVLEELGWEAEMLRPGNETTLFVSRATATAASTPSRRPTTDDC
ncbi:hypothetical protein CDO73_01860 [Saccharibacillus sp. O23]|uniref:hypothetical protein n=1 Tax=Saccharibacillus sp. O23 TaxID=2009338 RepID=UPI000B4E6ACB|nr:hypothetical protein [Saccharibacillus sp. O23]OWR32377.1 hypothetical protein CDO73_01860 [Saccharibacillus sp. O23]